MTDEANVLTLEEIRAFADDWYRKLDEHAPASDVLPLVIDEGLEFVVPEGTLRNHEEFASWYAGGSPLLGVINLFFNEVHTIRKVHGLRRVAVVGDIDRWEVKVEVNWQAHRWHAPQPRDEWIGFDAYQTWQMIRSPASGKPVIARYVVDELRAMPGSPKL